LAKRFYHGKCWARSAIQTTMCACGLPRDWNSMREM